MRKCKPIILHTECRGTKLKSVVNTVTINEQFWFNNSKSKVMRKYNYTFDFVCFLWFWWELVLVEQLGGRGSIRAELYWEFWDHWYTYNNERRKYKRILMVKMKKKTSLLLLIIHHCCAKTLFSWFVNVYFPVFHHHNFLTL